MVFVHSQSFTVHACTYVYFYRWIIELRGATLPATLAALSTWSPMTPKDPRLFSIGYSAATLASPFGCNDLIGYGLDHFREFGCSTRILQHPNASKCFSSQGAPYISKPTFLCCLMFSQNITRSIISHTYIYLWHIWTSCFVPILKWFWRVWRSRPQEVGQSNLESAQKSNNPLMKYIVI